MMYGIGIDTGGTFTDSVIVDFGSHRVISKAKALTTRQDLRIGIQESLALLDAGLFPEVQLVSLSTTLATNSVVEGKGARVGLIVAAPDERTFRLPAEMPAAEVAVIRGAHDRAGNETAPLDLSAARHTLERMKTRVEAFAVSGYFGIYNAEHELRLKELIQRECGKPVVCGHELSGAVGMIERAATACLNARLLPVIGELLDAVIHIMEERKLNAPLMVVRGDGSLISEKAARSRPVETILSGPAASVIGACWLTGLNDAVVVDMGGTTTDIGIVAGGTPAVSEDGATVGGWRTRTRAMDMWTAGVGGDSRILVKSAGEIQIGPRRVVPLSLASSQHPALKDTLTELASVEGTRLKDLDLDFFTLVTRPAHPIGKYEQVLLDALDGRVLHRAAVEREAGPSVSVDRFVTLGSVAEVSFTPTDLLHAQGVLALWDKGAAELALRFYETKTGLTRDAFVDWAFGELVERLKLNIAGKLLSAKGLEIPSIESRELLGSLLRMDGSGGFSAHFKMHVPLIAVGAPVRAYFPSIAADLGAQLVVPDHAEVANAAGAVTGRIIAAAHVLVRPVRPIGFAVVAAGDHQIFDNLEGAKQHAEQLVRSMAEQRAAESGGTDLETTLSFEEATAPVASGWGKSVFMELKITATAIGKPSQQR